VLFSGERSYEISKKVRKRTEFQFLFFKIRFKHKWKKKPIDDDVRKLLSSLNEKSFYFQVKFLKSQEREVVDEKSTSMKETIDGKMKVSKGGLNLCREKIIIRKSSWKNMIDKFVLFLSAKSISFQGTEVQRRKTIEMDTSPRNNNFSILGHIDGG
jgi:hypothetical protein